MVSRVSLDVSLGVPGVAIAVAVGGKVWTSNPVVRSPRAWMAGTR